MSDFKQLIPVNGAWVRLGSEEQVGRVLGFELGKDGPIVHVEWLKARRRDWVPLARLRSGFQLGMDVQDVPYSRVRRPLGEGHVVETRELGGRDQVLVEFPALGQRIWMPYETLKQIKGVKHRFLVPRQDQSGVAERFRLRSLAHALELWNENTGSLSHLHIDPLPHQIHLVHHILASGNLNWMIADDVGLGKTIEVGMLLAALQQRGTYRRILLVTPAGLTRQWQEELRQKFGMDDFLIYGEDFVVNDPRHWKLYDHVIGSVDRFKTENHKDALVDAGPWDLIVFDEAHRLSRRQWGLKLEASDRFRLADELRGLTDSLLLLTATPHQGMQDKFQALLELLRPELKDEIDMLTLNPDLLRDMVVRNNKADVTDAEGNFIFKGKTTRAIPVATSEESRSFDRALQSYLRRGYAAVSVLGRQGIAIGFVMTVYRKLAASSAAAIHHALQRRLVRLLDQQNGEIDGDGAAPDDRYEGEWEEQQTGSAREFFTGEIELLRTLIDNAARLVDDDLKVQTFIDGLVSSVLHADPEEKVLVFTEYRATQAHIAEALRTRFGADKVNLIHGGQAFKDRSAEIAHFEDQGQFLISTEAGGEGINLQRRCHVMVNFDLPWNPMRLVQRIGRLYRYGQDKRVVVFNVHAPQTLDAEIMELMYGRLAQVVADMAVLGGEFNEGLADDILGQMAGVLDVEDILEKAIDANIARTQGRIDEALRRAREAVAKQRELFECVTGYDPNETRYELAISGEHLRAFVEGMFSQLGIDVGERLNKGAVWDIRVPDSLTAELPGRRTRLRITFDRVWGADRPDIQTMDLQSPLMQLLLRKAKAYAFGGHVAALADLEGAAVLTAILRWQNDQGRRMRQEYTVARVRNNGRVETNPQEFVEWLLNPAADASALPEKSAVNAWFRAAEEATDRRLGAVSNTDLHPESRQWVSGGWC